MSTRVDDAAGGRLADWDYELPPDRVASHPTKRRDGSRLLVVPPGDAPFEHRGFRELPELLRPGDLLVVNESRVRPARLLGRKPTGAPAEILLLAPAAVPPSTSTTEPLGALASAPAPLAPSSADWVALVRPGSKLKPGRRVDVADGFWVEILDSAPGGGRRVRLHADGDVEAAIERYGHVPLPPYLGRAEIPLDRERYQTVYARVPGSVAAPTAGLHFTPELLRRLEGEGVRRAVVTLHVGVGTFRPVEAADPADHPMHHEPYRVPEETARLIEDTKAAGARVWAVGTTVVRTLEAAADARGRVRPGAGATDLFIRPPYRFRVVDALVTNFHLPRSTLLMLVAAFAGRERVLEAYHTAIREGYRFYSYGDAMALPGPSVGIAGPPS